MKRIFLLALTDGLLSPMGAKAESYKLLVKVREMRTVSTSVLTMASEERKKKIVDVDNWEGDNNYRCGCYLHKE